MKKYQEARSNVICGVLAQLFSIGFYLETYHFRLVKNVNTVNAAFFPRVIACVVFFCATLLVIQGVKQYRSLSAEEKTISPEEWAKNREGLFRIAQVFVILLAAAILFRTLGFLLTMPWMMFLLFVVLEKKENRRYGLYLAFSILTPLFMFAVFYYAFSTLLPMGILAPYLSMIL